MTIRFTLALLCLLSVLPAEGGALDFAGNWENAARDGSGISHVAISPAGGNHLTVRIYGDCHPAECDWGMVAAQSYTSDPRSGDVTSIAAVFNTGFTHKQVIFRRDPSGDLGFQMLTDFSDRSGRQDFEMSGKLHRSAWAGPVGQYWERPMALKTGWGGGARTGAPAEPHESCFSFDPKTARTTAQGTSWTVMTGDRMLVGPRADERDVLRVMEVIRHYHFDRQCHAGSTLYWKHGGTIPGDRMGGADCIAFNPTTAHATHIGHVWKIVDGVQWIVDTGTDKDGADGTLALIRTYRLDRECFVGGRVNPAMVYWLSH